MEFSGKELIHAYVQNVAQVDNLFQIRHRPVIFKIADGFEIAVHLVGELLLRQIVGLAKSLDFVAYLENIFIW